MGNAVDPKYRPRHTRAGTITGRLAEGAFIPAFVRANVSFNDKFRRCRNQQIVGLALDELDWCAAQPAGNLGLMIF